MKILVVTNNYARFKTENLANKTMKKWIYSFYPMTVTKFIASEISDFDKYDAIYTLQPFFTSDEEKDLLFTSFIAKIKFLLESDIQKIIIPNKFRLNTSSFDWNEYGLYGRYHIGYVINSKNIENLVMPNQMLLDENSVAEDVIANIGLPMMVKSVNGSGNYGTTYCQTIEELNIILDKIKTGETNNLFAQEYIECDNTTERWIMYNGSILNAAEKNTESEETYTQAITPSEIDNKLASDMAICFNGDYFVGVDLIRKNNQYYFLEAVTAPSNSIKKVTKHNHYRDILLDVINRLK